jgi:uncharacterized membrane protein YphA (DoxX/SURF4 family)
VRRIRGGRALAGSARAAGTGLAAAAAGALVGSLTAGLLRASGFWLNASLAVLACTCVLVIFCLIAYAADRGDLKHAIARVRRRTLPS